MRDNGLPLDAPEVVHTIWAVLESSPAVTTLRLGGSRANGYSTELSDWDLLLESDHQALLAPIPGLMAPLRPLAGF